MSRSSFFDADMLRHANIRLCRLCTWSNYEGLGFHLESSTLPPYIIRLVESNSPAAASGLKIRDVILAVNQQDIFQLVHEQMRNVIKLARDSHRPIEMLVVEQRFYDILKKKNIRIDSSFASIINTPVKMPDDYLNFPKHQPRTCQIHLSKSDTTFGFETANGENDIGVYIQEVFPNTPASRTLLRKSDRIIEIDDKFVDKDASKSILEKLEKAKAKGAVKLYVMDTDTYTFHISNRIPLVSKRKGRNQSASRYDSSTVDNDTQLPSSHTLTIRSTVKEKRRSIFSLRRRHQSNTRASILSSANEDELDNSRRSLRSIYIQADEGTNEPSPTFRHYMSHMNPLSDIAYGSDVDNQPDEEVNNDNYTNLSSNEISYRKIRLCKGDLITQQTDVIVICSSSQYLFDNICKAGGDSFLNSYKNQSNKNSRASIVGVNGAGQLRCKRVYFLSWKANSDRCLLTRSIKQFVSDAIENAVEEQYRSIAFPAIGCGQYGCSISLVAQKMVEEAYRQLLIHNITVSFVIQSTKNDIYDEFQKQINLITSEKSSNIMRAISESVGKGTMEVEEGDITMQEVDVIIGSSSSELLRKEIIKRAGTNVQTAYDAQCRNHPNSPLIATPSGSLLCKKIFFIKWQPDEDENILRESLSDLISIVIHNARSHDFTSIAFPAIGCGQHGCSVQIVVKTMVKEMKTQLIKRNLPWLVKFVIRPDQEHIYDEFCKQVSATQYDLIESQMIQLPPTWNVSREDTIRFVVNKTSEECKSIITNFDQAMQGKYTEILRIERIQNERWYLQYLAHCRDFKKRLDMDTERRLYHGCPEQAADSIIQACFNRSFAGVNGTVYGFGVYFSSNAAYSHGYTVPNTNGERFMFVARVLVGKTTLGNRSMKVPPGGFDSTTDDKHIFVTYHDAQAYAEYLIIYK